MNWTSEYPSRPGFYWLRNCAQVGRQLWTDSTIVEVDRDGDFYCFGSGESHFKHQVISAEWFGPITPPEPETPQPQPLDNNPNK
jgi:hypothetical protein